jgi:hypothetical protein
MSIGDKYFDVQATPNSVSGNKSPDETGYIGVVFQSGKPTVDFEYQLIQDIRNEILSRIDRTRFPSGFVGAGSRIDKDAVDYSFISDPADPSFVKNTFYLSKQNAIVSGIPVTVSYTNSLTETNIIELGDPPLIVGPPPTLNRTDFVFLEVWLSLVAPSPRAKATITVSSIPSPGDTVTINGNILTAVAGAPAVDQFQIGATESDTATNIYNAVNNVANSYFVDVYSTVIGDTVTIIAQSPGAVGNAITLASSVPLVMVISGANLSGGADRVNKPDQSSVYRNGNVLSLSNIPDDIMDDSIAYETSQRVQVQYRIRTTGQTEAVDYITEPNGFENPLVLAFGGIGSSVAGYQFVPADKATVVGSSSAVSYGIEDPGLWIAGDGSSTSATDLQTLDGFVYAVPIAFVYRKNDAYAAGLGTGFDPTNNTIGGAPTDHPGFASTHNPYVVAFAAGSSDRPDGGYPDAISRSDLMDLRRHISTCGIDYASELEWQLDQLYKNNIRTWQLNTADEYELGNGSGDVSTTNMICDEFGRSNATGGTGIDSGTTTRGNFRRNFDHIARRFGDQPVLERVVLRISKSYVVGTHPGMYVTSGGGAGIRWYDGDVITVDLDNLDVSTLENFDPATGSKAAPNDFGYFNSLDVIISDVISVYHDDGNYVTAVDQSTRLNDISGVGTRLVNLTLGQNPVLVNEGDPAIVVYNPMVGNAIDGDVGSARTIFVELEILYPHSSSGGGTSETPVYELVPDTTNFPYGSFIENDITQRPSDFSSLLPPKFREGKREIAIEYAPAPNFYEVVSRDTTNIITPSRMWGGLVPTYSDVAVGVPTPVLSATYGSSERAVQTNVLSGTGQTKCVLLYQPQEPVPNYGANGYQISSYYRTVAPQTAGIKTAPLTGAGGTLPSTLVVKILCMSDNMWAGQSSVSSPTDLLPYPSPIEQISDGGYSEDSYCSIGDAYISGMDIGSGLFKLTVSSVLINDDNISIGDAAVYPPNIDMEFRAYYPDKNNYQDSSSIPYTGMVTHKNTVPMLSKVEIGGGVLKRGDILLMVATTYRTDRNNRVRNDMISGSGDMIIYSIYKVKNRMIENDRTGE